MTATDHAQHHNNISDALLAIQAELGTLPKGTYADVKTRLSDGIYKTPSASQTVTPSADVVNLILKSGNSLNVANIFETRNSTGTILSYIDYQGNLSAQGLKIAGTPLNSTHLSDTADLARLASPAFTGNPTATTQSAGNNSTRIATTAFVTTAVGAAGQAYGGTVASASSIALTPNSTMLLTGTTTVATGTGGSSGNLVTLVASGQSSGVTVGISHTVGANKFSLRDGTAVGLLAGDSITFAYDGTQWIEISRNFKTLYATTLPSSPFHGMEVVLTDSTTTSTWQWRLRYNANASSSYKWDFVGGADFYSTVSANQVLNSTGGYYDLGTVGPSITVPRAGDYDVDFASQFEVATGALTQAYVRLVKNGSSISGCPDLYFNGNTPGQFAQSFQGVLTMANSFRATGLAANDVLKLQYYTTQASMYFANRVLRVTPVRVS